MRLFALVFALLCVPVFAAPASGPVVGRKLPEFAGLDLNGHGKWRLANAYGRSAAIFFFCGCEPCHICARQWQALRNRGVVDSIIRQGGGAALPPLTVVVFAGDEAAARLFARQTGLGGSGLVLIPDPLMATTNRYNVAPCPRVFVAGRNGILRYTNASADDAPQGDDETLIVQRALESLRGDAAAR
ncbi:MAG: hypothetical protein P4L33_22750 [Capsulimonadaceae bacterium]|nr:hypothetical protein [Capsulimonadaceae bacterium]